MYKAIIQYMSYPSRFVVTFFHVNVKPSEGLKRFFKSETEALEFIEKYADIVEQDKSYREYKSWFD